jgi:hypothetical protein
MTTLMAFWVRSLTTPAVKAATTELGLERRRQLGICRSAGNCVAGGCRQETCRFALQGFVT